MADCAVARAWERRQRKRLCRRLSFWHSRVTSGAQPRSETAKAAAHRRLAAPGPAGSQVIQVERN